MQMPNKLAAIVNCLSKDELANLSPEASRSLLHGLRQQPSTAETDAALKRLAMHLLRDTPCHTEGVPLLH
jgi:hypothetical protein